MLNHLLLMNAVSGWASRSIAVSPTCIALNTT